MAMCIQADRTPFTAGANDNASAVGLVLTLAETLRTAPLQHTRVWLACTGCEEVQHYGAIDFFRRHRSALRNPHAIAFEMLGCAGPSWLTKEGIIVPFHADPGLVKLAEEIAAQHPELAAHPAQISGGNTEMADALRLGIPAITLSGQTRDRGFAPLASGWGHVRQDESGSPGTCLRLHVGVYLGAGCTRWRLKWESDAVSSIVQARSLTQQLLQRWRHTSWTDASDARPTPGRCSALHGKEALTTSWTRSARQATTGSSSPMS